MNDILGKKEVLEELPFKERLLDYLIAANLIPHKRVNPEPGGKGHRTILFSRRQLLEWVESGNASSSAYNDCEDARAEAVC